MSIKICLFCPLYFFHPLRSQHQNVEFHLNSIYLSYSKAYHFNFFIRFKVIDFKTNVYFYFLASVDTDLSSLGVPGVPWYPQILADQLTLSQPGGADYARHINTGTPGFSDLPTALQHDATRGNDYEENTK